MILILDGGVGGLVTMKVVNIRLINPVQVGHFLYLYCVFTRPSYFLVSVSSVS